MGPAKRETGPHSYKVQDALTHRSPIDTAGFTWPAGQRAAVSLTYDDGLPVHREVVAPRLAELGLSATFYVNAHAGVTADPLAWRAVADAGHELGNHLLFHPCRHEPADGYGWLDPAYNLVDYSLGRWRDEVRIANALLKLIDGRDARSLGNTCCHDALGPTDDPTPLGPLALEQCVAARGPYSSKVVTPATLDLGSLGHFGADGRPFDALWGWIDAAAAAGGWVILMIHGVGAGTHGSLHLDSAVHERLVKRLSERRDALWTAPVVDVAQHLVGLGSAAAAVPATTDHPGEGH